MVYKKAEKSHSQCRPVLWQRATILEKLAPIVVGTLRTMHTRTNQAAFCQNNQERVNYFGAQEIDFALHRGIQLHTKLHTI